MDVRLNRATDEDNAAALKRGVPTISLKRFIDHILPNEDATALKVFYKLVAEYQLAIYKTPGGDVIQSKDLLKSLTDREAEIKPNDDFDFWMGLETEACYSVARAEVAKAYQNADEATFPWQNMRREPVTLAVDKCVSADSQSTKTKAPDEVLATLFDPVSTEQLAKMFPVGKADISFAQWKLWQDKAKANGLIGSRVGRGRFNPFIAGEWFVKKGAEGWDNARLYRALSNNLPPRSKDNKHLLTGEIE